MDDVMRARLAADRLDALVTRATPGDWRTTGLLATRPEVVAVRSDGSTEHVAEARRNSATWITAVSPVVGTALAAVLRAAVRNAVVRDAALPGPADEPDLPTAIAELARLLLERLPEPPLPQESR